MAKLSSGASELGCAVAAVAMAIVVAAILLAGGAVRLQAGNAGAFFVTVFLGAILSLVGAWLDVRRQEALGLMFLGLGTLLALDGIFATYFVGLPTFLLVAISFGAAIFRRRSGQSSQRDG